MATIYSNRNDNAGAHSTVDINTAAYWAGGVVPTSADLAYIVGRRTQINQASFGQWAGTRTITVDSTSNFASSGYFYTVTDQGSLIRVLYTGTTATTFTGCTYDESAFGNFTEELLRWDGGNIYDNAYVINPAYIMEIGPGETFECNELIIQEGGYLFVNGGTLLINQGIRVRDGFLIGRPNGSNEGKIQIQRNSVGLNGSYMGYLIAENYQLSIIDIDGGENRLYATLSATAAKDSSSVTVTGVTNGTFAVGDEVAIYRRDDYRRRNVGYTGYRDSSASFKDMDEGYDVCGVSGSTIYLATRNGARGEIKSSTTVGSQKVLNVDTGASYFKTGDKVVINNVTYTVDKVEDSTHTLYDYDFTNASTSLSDFWVDDADHVYSANWSIQSGVGLRNTAGAYRELVHKYCWRRDVVVEAEMSPLDGYTSGTRGTNDYGIITSYDPSFRQGSRSYDSFKTDYLMIDDANDRLAFYIRTASNYINNRLSRDTALRDQTRTAAIYTVDNRKGFTTVYINGTEFTKEFRRDGSFKGLVGIYHDNNTSMRCRRLTIKAPTQLLYITTNNSFTNGHTVYRTGTEVAHPSGSRIVKIASINTGAGSHQDLAFAYRGQRGNGQWPRMIQVNGSASTSTSLTYCHNHDMNVDYYYNLGNTTSEVSMTVDLGQQQTFTHVSFVPRINDYSGSYGFYGVTIYGSNDLSSWTTIYGPTDDTKKWYYGSYNRIAFYATGTRSFRYVKFATKGAQRSGYPTNRYVNIGVHNFSAGYTLTLNNASDFAVGDSITVLTDSGYSWGSREIEGYEAAIQNTTDPETYWQGGWKTECTITSKSGNTLYLDRPIFWGYVEDNDSVTVVKTNRKFTITGWFSTSSGSNNDWRWPTITLDGGSNVARKYLWRNIRFDYLGSYRYSGSGDYNRGFRNYSYDYWNAVNVDGCSFIFGPDGGTFNGVSSYSGHAIFRNNVIMNRRSVYGIHNVSQTGNAWFNNKMVNVVHAYIYYLENFAFNYNEIATCESGINVTGLRTERMVIPFNPEIRRNYVKGSSYTGLSIYEETVGPRRNPRIKVEYNKIRAMDDYAYQGRFFGGSPLVATDAFAEHTGSRLSRYRNEGFVPQGDTSSDLSYLMQTQDYGRYGYDLSFGVYHHLVRYHNEMDTTYIFNPNGDDYFPVLGMELDVRDNIPFQVQVKFMYRLAHRNRLQDDGANDGQLRCFAIQHGTIVQTNWGVTPSAAGTGWNTFTATFNSFAAEEGKAAVYLSTDHQNGYIAIKSGSATVLTDYGDKVHVVGNTFNLDRVWDQYHENKDTAKLTTINNRTVKLKRFKFVR